MTPKCCVNASSRGAGGLVWLGIAPPLGTFEFSMADVISDHQSYKRVRTPDPQRINRRARLYL